MNKVYTIGRDMSCDIVIPDPTDVISRVHATLKVNGKGKYTLIDQSRNGTYVNGIRMSANEEIPVSRKDVISFAHAGNLDWNLIPKEKHSLMIVGGVIAFLVIAAGICFIVITPGQEEAEDKTVVETPVPAVPEEIIEQTPTQEGITTETIYMKPVDKVRLKPPKKEKGSKETKETKETEQTQPEEPEVINPIL